MESLLYPCASIKQVIFQRSTAESNSVCVLQTKRIEPQMPDVFHILKKNLNASKPSNTAESNSVRVLRTKHKTPNAGRISYFKEKYERILTFQLVKRFHDLGGNTGFTDKNSTWY